jgi:hypothetical protein
MGFVFARLGSPKTGQAVPNEAICFLLGRLLPRYRGKLFLAKTCDENLILMNYRRGLIKLLQLYYNSNNRFIVIRQGASYTLMLSFDAPFIV